VISLEGVSARYAGAPLTGVTLAWAAGAHALVGGPGDGGQCILALLGGLARPRAGRVSVLGAEPTDPRVRRGVAHVPLDVALPEGLRVEEVLDIAAEIRGDAPRPADGRLATLGVESLARRPVRTLTRGECRAVALVEAITSSARVLLVEEPFVSLDPRATSRLAEALRSRAKEGAALVVSTASVRDAGELGDHHLLLRGGAVVGEADSLAALAEFTPSGARVRLTTNDPAALAAALGHEGAVEAVARNLGHGSVVARGRATSALAEAVARAVVESGVEVSSMRFEPPTLEEARAAASGVAAATYRAAFEHTRAAAVPEPAPASKISPPDAPVEST
jgi:ABC-2 type transport system ATP-binding protein